MCYKRVKESFKTLWWEILEWKLLSKYPDENYVGRLLGPNPS